jgi:hypothetical protein
MKIREIFYLPPLVKCSLYNTDFQINITLYRLAQALTSQRSLRLPEFLGSLHMKVVRLSALGTGRLYPPPPPQRDIPGTYFR